TRGGGYCAWTAGRGDKGADRSQYASARGRAAAGSGRIDRTHRVKVVIKRVENSCRRAVKIVVICAGADPRGFSCIDVCRIVSKGGLDRRRGEVTARIDHRIICGVASD